MGNVDSDGNRLLDTGTWNGATTLVEQGGQLMHFQITNQNVLGTTISIKADTGEKHGQIIAPQATADMSFPYSGRSRELGHLPLIQTATLSL